MTPSLGQGGLPGGRPPAGEQGTPSPGGHPLQLTGPLPQWHNGGMRKEDTPPMSDMDPRAFIDAARSNEVDPHDEDMALARRAKGADSYVARMRSATRPKAVKNNREWAEHEDQFLRDWNGHATVVEQAYALGRTYDAVKRRRINLKKRSRL